MYTSMNHGSASDVRVGLPIQVAVSNFSSYGVVHGISLHISSISVSIDDSRDANNAGMQCLDPMIYSGHSLF